MNTKPTILSQSGFHDGNPGNVMKKRRGKLLGILLTIPMLIILWMPINTEANRGSVPLFELVDSEKLELASMDKKRLETISRNEYAEEVSIVKFPEKIYMYNSFVIFLDAEDNLSTDADSRGHIAQIRKDTLIATGSSHLTWLGNIKLRDVLVGDINLTINIEGNVTGSMMINEQRLQIRPLSKGKHALYEVDYAKLAKKQREHREKTSEQEEYDHFPKRNSNNLYEFDKEFEGIDEASLLGQGCGPYSLDVAVYYTQNAAQGRDVEAIIAAAIAETNQAYNLSNIYMQMNLEFSQLFDEDEFEETPEIEDDLEFFASNAYLGDADIAVLLTDGPYSTFTGLASQILADEEYRHAIVQIDHAHGGSRTFAHEVGHLQGAQHHPDDPTDDTIGPGYERGHRWGFINRRSTIMAYEKGGIGNSFTYPTVNHFSNPHVYYSGNPTGTSGRDNARYMRLTALHVASLGGEVQLGVEVDKWVNHETGQGTFIAYPCGGTGGYSYTWTRQEEFSGDHILIGEYQQLNNYTFPEGFNLVNLKVESGGSEVLWQYIFFVSGSQHAYSFQQDTMNKEVLEPSTNTLETRITSIYPNPFNNETRIVFTLREETHVLLEVYDIMGRRVDLLLDEQLAAQTHNLVYHAGELATGTYILHLQAGNEVFTRQLSLIK